ncbi:hypothetical protein [Methanogenium cariaci]|jgi:hypothetical protein|uniref:hypothetical protein n=1 Tax=Methanogenium cariaci TaxID=2197 RepID=UPI0007803DD7|nr:hypothetical protein [Methanogenium cariaci]
METEDESITASNRALLTTIAIIAVVIIGAIVLLCYFIILTGEGFVTAGPHPRISDGDAARCEITQEDFKEHPALKELIVQRKYVLFSHGVLLDLLVRITPGTYSFSAVHDPGSRYSKRVISYEEYRVLENQYSGCAYNGTVYAIVQTA